MTDARTGRLQSIRQHAERAKSARFEADRIRREAQIFRRDKISPSRDFWHTLAVGTPIAVILWVLLPVVFRLLESMGVK